MYNSRSIMCCLVRANRKIICGTKKNLSRDVLADKYLPEEAEETEIFNKILVANRGEIACRIMKTCRNMGIKTVAVYSEKDAQEVHVKMADESVCVGPVRALDSYLNVDNILAAVKNTGAEAVHPGYGFLSENPKFARSLISQKVSFIGPNCGAIEAMGDKIQSKKIASKAGLSMIPGYDGEIKDISHCLRVSNEIGYPVMIKASAGGGGKGMRVAWNEKQAIEGFKLAKQEASSSFGDDRILVEKFFDGARHIEMQVLCDKYGNAVWLNERECSIQRRNQKVIEEAPSPFLDHATRTAMGEQACKLALAVGYDSAGTVEFLVDKNKQFYFLEMNTRLQVEHPITEAITGIDIVHQMIRLAYGHKLNINQRNVVLNGSSIECRIYAEDPHRNFGTPSTGRLEKYIEPSSTLLGVRCDSGVTEGSSIGIHYDPLICKLITVGETRDEALDLASKALDNFVIRGVFTNLSLLYDVINETKFRQGSFSTNYLFETYPDGFKGPKLTPEDGRCLAVVASYVNGYHEWKSSTSINSDMPKSKVISKNYAVDISNGTSDLLSFKTKVDVSQNYVQINIDDTVVKIEGRINFSTPVFRLNIDGKDFTGQLVKRKASGLVTLQYKGFMVDVKILPQRAKDLYRHMRPKKQKQTGNSILSPMPGLIKSIFVKEGESVVEGQEICVIEAMKMQNALTSFRSAVVKKICCSVGDTVDADAVLIEFS